MIDLYAFGMVRLSRVSRPVLAFRPVFVYHRQCVYRLEYITRKPERTIFEMSDQPGEAAFEIGRRKTFAIISHPDAGKTTLTEKLLLYGGAIRQAGSVKARKAANYAVSD